MRFSLSLSIATIFAIAFLMACGPGASTGTCDPGQTECNGVCVDTNSDSDNCGACGNQCTGTDMCDGMGSCAAGCDNGTVLCNGSCANLAVDSDNCGGCGQMCAPGEACMAGSCEDDSCTESSSEASSALLPADIIVVVDNSGSMTDEAASVQNSMNAFATTIINSDIDAHVIMISADSSDAQGVCVPAPLGSGNCPNDENLPGYRHIVADVGSSNALQLILDTYPQWQDSLRSNATRTIAVISDDDSGLSAVNFSDQLIALDPTFEGFKVDAIVAPYDLSTAICTTCYLLSNDCATCDACCGLDSTLGLLCTALPASQGSVYQDLVQTTGGVEGNLCTQDFLPAFQDMATGVIEDSQVSCLYDIPDAGNGMEIDFNRVNVEYQLGPGSMPVLLPNAPGGVGDCGANGGWYYNDIISPTQVLLCPTTCDQVQVNLEAKITVKFGCATVIE